MSTDVPFLPFEQGDPSHDEVVEIALPTRVVLYNDDWHTFDEVIEQIIRATSCSYDHAEACTYEVHHRGKSIVFEGDMGDCLRVSSVLEEISLHTQLEC